jgi:glycosyltransferase involved in cell wall biosynthesis
MKISVVTPSFQQGRFIRKTIDSVLEQKYPDKEYVVFDGGSKDETVPILKSYGGRLRWISEPDKGQTHAINKGIQATDGEIIGWLNSDDVYYPGALEWVAQAFREHPAAGVVYGAADHIDEADKVLEPYPVEEWNFDRMKETCIICQPACFFRRSVVERHGLLDEKLNWCMDYEFWLRLGKKGVRFLKISHKLAGSRMYADNKTLSARVKIHEQINDVMKTHFGRVPDRWIFNLAHYRVAEKVDRVSDEKKFSRMLAWESLRSFLRWSTWPKYSSIRSMIHWA